MAAIKNAVKKWICLIGRARLVTIYMWIVIFSFAVWLCSFLISNRIARDSIVGEYIDYNEALFDQTKDSFDRTMNDLVQLSYSIMSDSALDNFLRADNFSGKNEALSDVNSEFRRLRTIQDSIDSISLYDMSGVMVAHTGIGSWEDFSPDMENSSSILFTGKYVIDNKPCFGMQVPVYSIEDSKIASQSGYCCILFHLTLLEELLPKEQDTASEWCVIIDENNAVILERGERPDYLKDGDFARVLDSEQQTSGGVLVYCKTIENTEWNLIFGIPEESLFLDFNRIQKINLVTYLVTGILMLVLFIGIYASFLRPVREQIQFMNYYTVNRKSRAKVTSHNEMGVLAENLNAMLDDLERLNSENLQASRRILDAEYQKKQSELLAYRNQINPHFLYNTFECIRGMALLYDVPDIASISEALAGFFSYNVRGRGYAPMREIRTHAQDYATIIDYRFMGRFKIECQFEEDILDVIFPKMVIQPLLENAVFHGFETTEKDGLVVVNACKKDNRLCIRVEDNGCGMDDITLEKLKNKLKEYDRTNLLPVEKHGIGTVNLYRRLRIFYGESCDFVIESKKDCGTKVYISVPIEADISEEEYVPGFFD